jgi:hypothetical protein
MYIKKGFFYAIFVLFHVTYFSIIKKMTYMQSKNNLSRKSKYSLEHFLTRNHSNLGMGSPVISKMTKACSPSVDENLSGGFTNFGSFPEADSGVELLSQSYTQQLYSTQLAVLMGCTVL